MNWKTLKAAAKREAARRPYKSCDQKQKDGVNARLVELCSSAAPTVLTLDSVDFNTSTAFIDKYPGSTVHVPNPFEFDTMVPPHDSITALDKFLGEHLEECTTIYDVVFFDYCGHFEGNRWSTPEDEIRQLVSRGLLSNNSLFAITVSTARKQHNLAQVNSRIISIAAENYYTLTNAGTPIEYGSMVTLVYNCVFNAPRSYRGNLTFEEVKSRAWTQKRRGGKATKAVRKTLLTELEDGVDDLPDVITFLRGHGTGNMNSLGIKRAIEWNAWTDSVAAEHVGVFAAEELAIFDVETAEDAAGAFNSEVWSLFGCTTQEQRIARVNAVKNLNSPCGYDRVVALVEMELHHYQVLGTMAFTARDFKPLCQYLVAKCREQEARMKALWPVKSKKRKALQSARPAKKARVEQDSDEEMVERNVAAVDMCAYIYPQGHPLAGDQCQILARGCVACHHHRSAEEAIFQPDILALKHGAGIDIPHHIWSDWDSVQLYNTNPSSIAVVSSSRGKKVGRVWVVKH